MPGLLWLMLPPKRPPMMRVMTEFISFRKPSSSQLQFVLLLPLLRELLATELCTKSLSALVNSHSLRFWALGSSAWSM